MNKPGNALGSKELLDMYFLENRARLLEIASFLDRIERAPDTDAARSDFRYRSFVKAIGLLLENSDSGRTRSIQLGFSDPTSAPIASAAGLKAHGAWDGGGNEDH